MQRGAFSFANACLIRKSTVEGVLKVGVAVDGSNKDSRIIVENRCRPVPTMIVLNANMTKCVYACTCVSPVV